MSLINTLQTPLLAPTTSGAVQRQRLLLLQCFRGLAASSVVLFHTAVFARDRGGVDFFWKWTRAGATGVDFFFVLSGFIIFWTHGRDIGHRARLTVYSWRRFCRVYPLYAICTLLIIPLYLAGFGHAAEKLTWGTIARSFALMPFAPGERPLIAQGWTLSHEAFFYVLFGLFVAFGKKWAWSLGTILLAGSIVVTGLALEGVSLPGPFWISHWILSPYNLEFAAGCGAAFLAKATVARRIRLCLPLGLILLGLIWTIPSQNPNEQLVPNDALTARMVLFFGSAYTLITIGSVAWELSGPIHPPRLLMGLGDATYSIYLSHFVIVSALTALVLHTVDRNGLLLYPALCLSAIVAAALGYCLYRWFRNQCWISCGD